jgi:hypothetical protein
MKRHKPRDRLTLKPENQVSDSGIAQVVKQQNAEILPTYQLSSSLYSEYHGLCVFRTFIGHVSLRTIALSTQLPG